MPKPQGPPNETKAPERRAITAAAARIDIGKKSEVERHIKRREQWQAEAWGYYDAIGEAGFAGRYIGNANSKVRLFAAEKAEEPDKPPVPTDNQAAIDALERLDQGDGLPQLQREGSINLSIAGEFYLIGWMPRPEGDTKSEERWEVRSVDEVIKDSSGKTRVYDTPDQSRGGRELTKDDFIARIWARHPRYSGLAESPMKAVLASCEELLIIERAVRAVARSRAAGNGILVIASEVDLGTLDPTKPADDPANNKFFHDLVESMATPLEDEGVASSVVPLVVKVPGEWVDKVKHVSFDRQVDKFLADRTIVAQKRFAQGIDLPLEVVMGIGDINHWGAWQISDDTFQSHIEPGVQLLCAGITTGYFRGALKEAGVTNPQDYLVWYDPSNLVGRPTPSDAERLIARDAHDRIIISDEAYRTASGFDEDDAPEDAERQRRLAEKAVVEGGAAPEEIPEAPAPTEEPDATTASVIAAGRRTDLGRRLYDIDRTLKDRLHIAADAAMTKALDRVGAKLRSKAKKDSQMTASIDNIRNSLVASTLGPALVAALGADEDELLQGAFEAMHPQFDQWVKGAQEAALALLPRLGADQRNSISLRQESDRAEAWAYLSTTLLETARSKLFDASPSAPTQGEFDATVAVPYGIVRAAVAVAGGAEGMTMSSSGGAHIALSDGGTRPVGGIATGQVIRGAFGDAGLGIDGYEWVYGVFPRSRPFEPHAELDGIQFSNFDDPQLINTEGFPDSAYFLPGDHSGCVCDVMPVVIEMQAAA